MKLWNLCTLHTASLKLLDNGPERVETRSRLITDNLDFLPTTAYLHGFDIFCNEWKIRRNTSRFFLPFEAFLTLTEVFPCFFLSCKANPSTHIWCYSPFRALASLIKRLHSSPFSALHLHPLIPSSCNASLWTTSAHLFLGLPTGLGVWKFPFKTFFLESFLLPFLLYDLSILIFWFECPPRCLAHCINCTVRR